MAAGHNGNHCGADNSSGCANLVERVSINDGQGLRLARDEYPVEPVEFGAKQAMGSRDCFEAFAGRYSTRTCLWLGLGALCFALRTPP